MSYVQWNTEEKVKLLDFMSAAVIGRRIKIPFERGVLLKLVREAQEKVLPEHRRRAVQNTKPFEWMEESIAERIANPTLLTQSPPAATVKVVSSSVQEAPSVSSVSVISTVEKATEEVAKEVTNTSALFDLAVEEVLRSKIVQDLIEAVAAKAVLEIQARVQQKVQEVAEKVTTVAPQVKPQKKKVVVVGLKPNQAHEVETSLGKKFNFVFLETSKVGEGKVCKEADLVVVMTDWVNHSVERKIRGITDKWERLPGTVSSLKRFLELKEQQV